MRRKLLMALAAISIALPANASETRCGWYSPYFAGEGGALLTDSQGQWRMYGERMTFKAQGTDNLPSLDGKQYIDIEPKNNQGWGIYGCACLEVETNSAKRLITVIYGGEVLPLSNCRNDPNLPSNPFRR